MEKLLSCQTDRHERSVTLVCAVIIFFQISIGTGQAFNLSAMWHREKMRKIPTILSDIRRHRPLPVYSTVTLFARFLGWSTSVPLKLAMW